MRDSPSNLRLGLTLAIGMLAVSAGAVLVRYSHEAPTLVIALYRVGLSSLVFAPFYWSSSRMGDVKISPTWQLAAAVGLSLHFAFWIASLRYTSVAVSVLLVNTAPAVVALVADRLLGERLTSRGVIGLLLALGGATLLVLSDLAAVGSAQGALLALAAAVMLALYLLAGRILRPNQDLVGYAFRTYAGAAVILALLTIVAGQPLTGFDNRTYIFLFLLAAGPQCLGHTSYNWALRYLPATLVAALILAEPVLAPVWAWWLLNEVPSSRVLLAGAAVAAGLLLLSKGGVRGGY